MVKRNTLSGIVLMSLLTGLSALTLSIPAVGAVDYTDVTATEAKSMIDSNPLLMLLDVRTLSEYDSGHIQNAKLIPVTELPGRLGELNQTDEILVYCGSGGRSRTASQLLVDNGFLYVYNMLGGIASWISEGYPVYIQYSSIQEAINNAAEGDMILVSSGTYYENVVVNRTVSLIGENWETTIIDGGGTGTVVEITRNNVTFAGFTIQNSGFPNTGVQLNNANRCNVSGNNVTDNWFNLDLHSSSNNSISGNRIRNGYYGIRLHDSSSQNSISGNNSTKTEWGICLADSSNNSVFGNSITAHGWGVSLGGSSNNTVSGNNIKENLYYGIFLGGSSNNTILDNDITGNDDGIGLSESFDNAFYHNNLINNTQQVYFVIMSGFANVWDDGYPSGGNYWDDYIATDLHLGPYQNIAGSDGIGDTPYIIDANNTDNYPLMEPYVQGNLSVSIFTDKTTYHAGDTMRLGLNITNPDSVKYQCLGMWCTLPDSSIYPVMHQHSVVLPIGLEYSNPSFKALTLPSLPNGTYKWHVALLDRATHTITVHDTAEWAFS